MDDPDRVLTLESLPRIEMARLTDLEEVGRSIEGKRGLDLLNSLKRERLDHGPYQGVTLFEAANRIMSDLVILKGIRWLLENKTFPLDAYTVEFGNENRNGFDITAEQCGKKLVGEAFNVAPSFYPVKRRHAAKKLEKDGKDADWRIILVNADAFTKPIRLKHPSDVQHFAIDMVTNVGRRFLPFE
ncbi:MAG: hypothetical protein NVV67_19485 [Pseudoxanthomonas sp.]|nr:hypothetical protein [Pseudoxanthomonas sp.]